MTAQLRSLDLAFFDLSARVKLRINGSDRLRFLNGQLTNDIRKATGTVAVEACVLSAKGKLEAHLFVHQDVESFLRHESRHHSEDGTARRTGKLDAIKQQIAAEEFSIKMARIVSVRQEAIRRRIPARIVRAIQNSGELVRVFAQHDIEPAAAFRRQHFAAKTLAHGRDLIGENDAALEQIHSPEELQAAQREVAFRKIR